jgi:hypothetical protein
MKMNMESLNSSYNFSFSFNSLLILIIYNTWIFRISLIKEKKLFEILLDYFLYYLIYLHCFFLCGSRMDGDRG